MASYFATASKIINSRPSLHLEDGRVYSPYDLLRLSLLGGGFPDKQLLVSTENKQIKDKLDIMAKMKRSLQNALFAKYTEQLYFSSDYRQRGNFQMHSKFLEPGDVILSNKAFELTDSFVKSLRRVAYLDIHKKHAVVYHQIDPSQPFDLQAFTGSFKRCKTKDDRQNLVTKALGRHSFESIDLRKCSFVAKQNEGPNIDCFFRRSKDQTKIHPIDDDIVFSLNGAKQLYDSNTPGASAVLPILPAAAVNLAQGSGKKKQQVRFAEEEQIHHIQDKKEEKRDVAENRAEGNDQGEKQENQPFITRSGRISKPPNKLYI